MVAPAALALRPSAAFSPRRAKRPLSLGAIPRALLLACHLRSINKGFDKLRNLGIKTNSFSFRAVSVDSNELGSSESTHKEYPKRYRFVVANAKFMLDEEEHFKELLFEKLRNYGERNKELDFWLVIEPKFLDRFPDITKRLKRPAVALVSPDERWITFMKLRLDRVLSGYYEADTVEEALASNKVNLQFEQPEKWVAPYPKYEFGWWESFLPPVFSNSEP